jgi:hypothetical protein
MNQEAKEGLKILQAAFETGNCLACEAGQGQLHEAGCDWEECPVCHSQMIACNCDIPTLVGMSLSEARDFEQTGQFTGDYAKKWESVLTKRGLVPWGQEERLKKWIKQQTAP